MITSSQPKEFTGRHMLAILLAFFGVVIAVNATFATLASMSWTGLVAEDTFVASQQFNEKERQGRAQAALGWKGVFQLEPQLMRYRLQDASGSVISPRSVTVTFKHPAYDSQDRTFALSRLADGAFGADQSVRDGVWIVQIDSDVGTAQPFRQVLRVMVSNGRIE